MKTNTIISAIVISTVISAITFAACPVMAQQGGIGGKLNLKSSVSVSGKIKAEKNGRNTCSRRE